MPPKKNKNKNKSNASAASPSPSPSPSNQAAAAASPVESESAAADSVAEESAAPAVAEPEVAAAAVVEEPVAVAAVAEPVAAEPVAAVEAAAPVAAAEPVVEAAAAAPVAVEVPVVAAAVVEPVVEVAAPVVVAEAAPVVAAAEPVVAAEPVAVPAAAAAAPAPVAAAEPVAVAPAAAAPAKPVSTIVIPARPVAPVVEPARMVTLKASTTNATGASSASPASAASSSAPFGAKVQPKAPAEENKEAWVQTQQKTFTKWSNNHLRKNGFPQIDDAAVDFETGIRLMQLVSALYKEPIPKHNANPKMRPHKLDNITLALKMVDDCKIKTNFLKSTHLIDHDLKMILGMMWAIILDYSIKGISEDDTSAKEGLLLWCRKKTAGYREVDPPTIQNFTTNWKNGMAFCALIHKHQPQLIDYDSLDKNDAAKNLELAFSVAEGLGIPRLLDIEDLLTEKPDERSVMTQVSEYFHRFAQSDAKETAARRAANFLGFAKKMNDLKNDYEACAKALLAWVQSVSDRFANENFGATLEDSLAVNQRLRSFILNEKPAKTAEKLDLESKYAEIQQILLVHDRPAYDCPKEIAPEAIDAAFDSLWEAEKKHATAARQQRFKFISKEEKSLSPEKLKEMKDSYAAFDKSGDQKMDRVEFKAALSAMSISTKDDAALQALFTKVSGGAITVNQEQWIVYHTELATDKDTPEQIIAAFRTLADDRETITADGLRVPPLQSADVDYMIAAHPGVQGGMDYKKYVNESFAAKQ